MPQLEYFLVAEGMAADQTTNRVSIFNVLEEIYIRDFPAQVYTCVAITLWRAEPGDQENDFQAKLIVHTPDGEKRDFPMNFTMTGLRHRTNQTFQGIEIKKTGELRFEMRLNDKHCANHIVTVHHTK
jgi:hypothetical protein